MHDEEALGFELLLADADDGRPTLEGGLPGSCAGDRKPVAGSDMPLNFWDDGGDQNSLPDQRWGILAPEGKRGDAMLAALAPLIALRDEEQEAEHTVHRLPPDMTADEAARWRREVFDRSDGLKGELPRFQLILGDLHEVSSAVHEVQGLDGYVGRLAFDELASYEAYADKVIRSEQAAKAEAARALFYTVHDGSAATRVGHRAMVEPAVELARKARESGNFVSQDLQLFGRTSDPIPDELFEQTRRPDPAVLMSVSHGAGAPRGGWKSAAAQREGQGSMCFGREGKLPADEFRDTPFLPMGFWLMFACFGAGTPSDSKFRHWLDYLRRAKAFPGRPEAVLKSLPVDGARPFISAPAKTCLANPQGPLAIVGHLDLAWSYSFQDLDTGKAIKRPARFLRVLDSVLKGDRYGLSTRELYQVSGQANQQLIDSYDQQQKARVEGVPHKVNQAARGHLWMMRQDMAGFVMLGDPAARLPIVSVRERRRAAREAKRLARRAQAPMQLQSNPTPQVQPIQQAQQVQQVAPPAAKEARKPSVETCSVDIMEQVVMDLLSGETTPKLASKEHGVSMRAVKKWEAIFTEAGRRALEQLGGGE